MHWAPLSAQLLLSAGFFQAHASPVATGNDTRQWDFPEIPSSRKLKWYPCYTNYSCAMLDVPLDYLNPSLGRAGVPIIKKSSKSSFYKGIVFLNPGGPGGSGIQQLLSASNETIDAVGPDYDLASWEPRGIGYSIPALVSCYYGDVGFNFSISESRSRALRREINTKHRRDVNDYLIHGPNLPFTAVADANTYANQGESCAAAIGKPLDAGPHMTTATVARDLVSILDAYAKTPEGRQAERDPKLLNFWGFSYGSVVGQTFASMFPKRVGRVVVDGVIDPDAWVAGDLDAVSAIDQDKILATFFVYCHHAGPVLCPFSGNTTTSIQVYNRFQAMIAPLDVTYATQRNWTNATDIQLALRMIQSGLLLSMYDPIATFPVLGTGLVLVGKILLSGNLTFESIISILDALGIGPNSVFPDPPPGDPNTILQFERFTSVACSDTGGKLYNSSFAEYAERLPRLQNQSWIAGNALWQQFLPCLSWRIKSDDVFAGPFGGRLKGEGRLLVVGNRFDNVTPLKNAQKTARIFPDAGLLTIEGTGHTSLATHNHCAFAKINSFFNSDERFKKESHCALEVGPWNITLKGSLEDVGDVGRIARGIEGMKG